MPLLVLRGAAALAALWLLVRLLPGLPDAVAALGVVVLGSAVALPQAWAGAVRRGHGLGVLAARGALRGLLAGAGLRVGLAGLMGIAAAGLAVLRLSEAGLALWVLAGLALPVTWGLMAGLAPRFAAQAAGLHARRFIHVWARLVAVGLLVAAALVAGMAVPAPVAPVAAQAAAPLVAEALEGARLWAGLEAYALGQAAEFGAWGRGLALLVAAGALVGVFWALTGLAVALALPWAEWRRALAPASDAPEVPGLGWAGPVVAGALVVAVPGGAVGAGAWLGGLPPGARPVAQAQVAVERIGATWHAAGTAERIAGLRAEALAEDAAARAEVLAALEAGFAAMEANVEGFLDDYYSLSGEYERLWQWVWGGLEDHLTAQMAAALQAGAPFGGFEAAFGQAMQAAQVRADELAAAETALLAATRIEGANPARLRVVGQYPPLPLREVRLAGDLAAAQGRWVASAGTGVVAAAVAQRVVAGLAARGLLGTAARVALRAGGVLVALGADAALVELDEYLNRDTFRAEILADIEAQRQVARAALMSQP